MQCTVSVLIVVFKVFDLATEHSHLNHFHHSNRVTWLFPCCFFTSTFLFYSSVGQLMAAMRQQVQHWLVIRQKCLVNVIASDSLETTTTMKCPQASNCYIYVCIYPFSFYFARKSCFSSMICYRKWENFAVMKRMGSSVSVTRNEAREGHFVLYMADQKRFLILLWCVYLRV